MKSKAPLVMIEQMVMILVFALAAALCVQAFVLSDGLSQSAEQRDVAVVLCESAAESVKYVVQMGGEWDFLWKQGEGCAYFDYDSQGNPTDEPSTFRLEVTRLPGSVELLGQARAVVKNQEGKELYSLEFAWQEVD